LLATLLGFSPITLGRLEEGGLLQQFGGPLTMHSLIHSNPTGGGITSSSAGTHQGRTALVTGAGQAAAHEIGLEHKLAENADKF
jgi:hypothetical protein